MTSVRNHQLRLNGSKLVLLVVLVLSLSSCGLFNKARDNDRDKVVTDQVEENLDTLDLAEIPETEIVPITKNPVEEEPEEDFSPYKKDLYRIAMLVPFNAKDSNYDPTDASDEKFVNYYAGVKLALEELESKGYNFDVRIYDTERSTEVVDQRLSDGSLNNADVIVGPYDRDGLTKTADFGKERKTAVVSPWLSSTKITDDNPFYIQLRPSLSSHYFKLIDHVNQNFRSEEIILIGRDIKADKNRFRYFQRTYSAINDFNNGNELREYLINDDSLSYAEYAFGDLFSGGGKKAIILPNWNYNDEDFIYSVLRRLNIERGRSDVHVYGMPILFDSDKIDFDFYNNLNLRICLSEFVDWEDEKVKSFMRKFYDTYGALATSDAFEGYDMMNFIGSNLIKYGINFQLNLEQDRERYLQTAYDIQSVYEVSDEKFENIKYLENKHLDLVQYVNDKFVKID